MIFATIGMQKPFPRLVTLVAAWARAHPDEAVVLQGAEGLDDVPANLTCRGEIPEAEFSALVARASVVVAHAGVGTILAAREAGVPVVLVPRRADLGEHRNDHQADTIAALEGTPGLFVVHDDEGLVDAIEQARLCRLEPAAESEALAGLAGYVGAFVS